MKLIANDVTDGITSPWIWQPRQIPTEVSTANVTQWYLRTRIITTSAQNYDLVDVSSSLCDVRAKASCLRFMASRASGASYRSTSNRSQKLLSKQLYLCTVMLINGEIVRWYFFQTINFTTFITSLGETTSPKNSTLLYTMRTYHVATARHTRKSSFLIGYAQWAWQWYAPL